MRRAHPACTDTRAPHPRRSYKQDFLIFWGWWLHFNTSFDYSFVPEFE